MKLKRLLAVLIALTLLFTSMTSALAANKTAEKEAKTKPTLKLSAPSSVESGGYGEFSLTASMSGFVTIMLTDSFGNPVVTIADNEEIHSKENSYEMPAFTVTGAPLSAGSYNLVASMTSQYGTESDSVSKTITITVPADETALGTTTGLASNGTAYNPYGTGTTGTYNPTAAGTYGTTGTYNPSAAGTYGTTGTYNPSATGTTGTYNPSATGTTGTYNPSTTGTTSTYNPNTSSTYSTAGTTGTYNPSSSTGTTPLITSAPASSTYNISSTVGSSTYNPNATGTTSAYGTTGTTSTYDTYGSTGTSAYSTTGTGSTSTYDPYNVTGNSAYSSTGTGTTSAYGTSTYSTTGTNSTSTYDPYNVTGNSAYSSTGTNSTSTYDPYNVTGNSAYSSTGTGTTSAYGTSTYSTTGTGSTSTYDPYNVTGNSAYSSTGTGTTSTYDPYAVTGNSAYSSTGTGTTSTYDPYAVPGTSTSSTGTSTYNPYGTTGTSTYDPYASTGTTYDPYSTTGTQTYNPYASSTGTAYDPYNYATTYDPYSYNTTYDPTGMNGGAYAQSAAAPDPVVTYQSSGGYLSIGAEGYQVGVGVSDVYPQKELNYWNLPNNPTDADLWTALTRPITCVNAEEQESTYIYDSVDKGRAKIGTIAGTSQGVNVLVTRDDGWSLVEAYRNEDGAFVRGYIKTAKLKLSDVNTVYGFVIDKRTQTLTVFMNGKRIGSCLVCTGLATVENLQRETPAGEFKIAMRRGTTEFIGKQKGYSRYTVRINNNVYLQEIPTTKRNGSDYSILESYLGSKQTRGTICLQARASQDGGINAEAIWNITDTNKKVKVIILDDKTRDMIPVGVK